MAFTRVRGPGITTDDNYRVGILTATKFVGPMQASGDSDFTNISATGIGTIDGVKIGDPSGIVTASSSSGIVTYYGDASKLTGLTAGQIPNLAASKITSGTIDTARLGSGTANNTSFLRGDQTWASNTSTTINSNTDNYLITGTGTADTLQGESNLTFNGNRLTVDGDVYVSGSQNAQLTTNQLIFDRAGYSYIDNSNDAGSLVFRVTSGNTIALRLDNSAQAHFGSSLIIPDAIQHLGDLDCKIRFPGTDTITFETASNERLRITSTGQVAIGTDTAETGYILSMHGDLSLGEKGGVSNTYIDQKQDGDLHLINSGRTAQGASGSPGTAGVGINRFNNISGGTSLFRDFAVYNGKDSKVLVVDGSASSVGIGTDSPASLLDVVNTGGAAEIICKSSTQPRLMLKTTGTTSECRVDFGDSGDSSRGAIGYNHSDDALKFYTTGVANERLRIDSSGRLLINATATRAIAGGNSMLQIEKNSSELATFLRTSNDNGAAWLAIAKSRSAAGAVCQAADQIGGIAFVPHDGIDLNHHAAEIRGYVDTGIGSNDTPGYLTFNTNGGTTTTTERMRITSSGELLLGTGGVDRGIAGQGFNSGSGWSGGIQIERANPAASNNTGLPWLALTAWNGAPETYTGGISFNRSNNNTQGTQGAVTTAQELGNISFNGSDGTNFINGAEIYAIPDATYSTNSAPTRLEFATTVTGTSDQNPKPRVRINSKGFTGPIPRSGAFQGTYVYRQRNQASDYKHYIRGPLAGYISSDLTGDNTLAYIQVQCMGTGTDNAWCYYRYSRDASSGATQVNLDHLSGGSSGNSNVPYMELYNGEAAWLMAHSTQYYVIVRVVVIGGTNEITYTTSGEYGSN